MSQDTHNALVTRTIELAQGDYQAACAHLKQGLIGFGSNLNALNNLGLMFYHKVEYDLACRCFYHVLELDDKQYRTHNNLGLTLNRFGLGAQAVTHYRKALDIKQDYHPARSNLAYALHYFGDTGRPEILQAHKAIAENVFSKSTVYLDSESVDRDPNRRLNIGYVSSDLRNHAVGRFIAGILEHHDRRRFQVHVFDNRANNTDDTAQQLKKLGLRWHQITGLNTDQTCKLICASKIDILIDLSGHTGGGRPDVFSQRVAPVQITYLGYPNTSGLPTMDYRIGDRYADPAHQDSQVTEKMLRLPHSMWTYQPWRDMPMETACPFERNGYITFGSANNHAKLQKDWMAQWAKLISRIPESRFLIKSRALRSPVAAKEFLDFFAEHGVVQERITIEHYSPTRAGHWQTLSKLDIAFDSYPYNGTTTTCDLLWLGVPMITRAGNSHVSRTSASILNALGMDSWIATSEADFISIALEKAQDLDGLRKLRQSLRHRFQASTLGHPKLFMQEYESILRGAWRDQS